MTSRYALLNEANAFLAQHNVPFSDQEAVDLLTHTLEIPRMSLFLEMDAAVDQEGRDRFWKVIQRRGKREPFSHIVGEDRFLGVDLSIDRTVLTPRPETEILASSVADVIKKEGKSDAVLLDLCCGSGCLGLSLKKCFPGIDVILSDLSSKAVAMTEKNAGKNGLSVEVLQGDLFDPLGDRKVDYLVCNPPYLAEREWGETEPEVRLFEPYEALVGGETGLEFYQRIAEQLPRRLKQGGMAWFEIGYQQGEAVKGLFEALQGYSCRVSQDWSGKDRFLAVFSLENE